MDTILEIKNYSLNIEIDDVQYGVLKDLNFTFQKGKIHAIVGESGCGKTLSMMSILRLLPKKSHIINGEILFENNDILKLKEQDLRKIRGKKIALIPQDPMTSLNPLYTIENQLLETILLHKDVTKEAGIKLAIETLESLGFKNAKERIKGYPHELSGGMKQRVIIAMALACDADILIADEPTTALDATIQAQILELLEGIKKQGRTIILITHDLAIVSKYADDITIMYLGNIVEQQKTKELFQNPKHPYTKALIASLPNKKGVKLKNIKGQPPSIKTKIMGCDFHPRCDFIQEDCLREKPKLKGEDSKVACHFAQG